MLTGPRGEGDSVDAEQRYRHQIDYLTGSQHYLHRRAPWIKQHKTPRTGSALLDGMIDMSDIEKATALVRKWGRTPPPLHWLQTPTLAEYVIDAPAQPRPLTVRNFFQRDSIKPLRLVIQIDGSAQQCAVRYANWSWSSGVRTTDPKTTDFLRRAALFSESDIDIEYVLSIAEAIITDRLALMRLVRREHYGYAGDLRAITRDVIAEPTDPIQFPPRTPTLDDALEAIIYTWTGEGDRYLIEPRYDSTT
jgi:hypothetical protein